MPRQARLDSPGTLHHVIVRGIGRGNIVDDDRDREDFIGRMGEIALDTETGIYAWALLTNHAHILLRSSTHGLPKFMRRFLTGYAISYNLIHRRNGHLFQNRYKSILCEEDPYFKELVRYIHLNPLRAGLVGSYRELNRYPWSGHSVVVGKIQNDWQQRGYVLKWFDSNEKEAVKAYSLFVQKGIGQGRRSELVGGGLIRSMGGWSAVRAIRRSGEMQKGDERILGSTEFVQGLLDEAEKNIVYQVPTDKLLKEADSLVEGICSREGVAKKTLLSGSRIGPVSRARRELAVHLVRKMGLSLADTARLLGVTTSAVAQILRRLN